jgi:hypothetical protein
MKKFWLYFGIGLILACWCGGGYYGFGTCKAFGQYYDPRLSCDPRDPQCYRDYHAAPYADPLSQFLYYIAPPVGRDQRYDTHQRYQHQETNRERRERERRERQDLRQRQHQQRY